MVAVGGDWRTLGSCGQGSRTEFLKRATSDSWWKAWSRREQAARHSFQQGLACSRYQAFPIMMDGYPWKYEQNKSFLLYVFLVRYLVLLLRNVANTSEYSPTCCAGNVISKFTWWWYLDVGYFGRKLGSEEFCPHGWMKSGNNGDGESELFLTRLFCPWCFLSCHDEFEKFLTILSILPAELPGS